MKTILPLLLLCLLLCGCAEKAPIPSDIPTPEPAPQSHLPSTGYYDPESKLERATGGTLQVFPLGRRDVTGIRAFGSGILLFSGAETTTLTFLTGETFIPAAVYELQFRLDPRDPSLRFWEDRFSFYDQAGKQTLILDDTLQILSRIPAPEGLQGVPLLSDHGQFLYYCTSGAVRCLDRETGRSRCLKEMAFDSQVLTGLILEDSILSCQVTHRGKTTALFLSAQTGRHLESRPGDISLTSGGSRYYATLPGCQDPCLVFGSRETGPQLFLPADTSGSCIFLEAADAAVTVTAPLPGKLRLDYYDLSSGLRRSGFTLNTRLKPLSLEAAGGRLFLLIYDPDYSSHTLYRWEIGTDNALSLSDTACYISPYRTASQPDLEEIARCQAYAAELGTRYGIEIRLWEEAASLPPPNYQLVSEHQAAVLWRELQLLDQRLSCFPSPMLPDTASHFSSLTLCIVREISGTPESGNQETLPGIQFLDGTAAYVVIAAGSTSENALYQGLYRVMETRLLTKSIALDQWDALNPFGFNYSFGGSGISLAAPASYLQEENRAFVDIPSMDSPRADRAAMFAAALGPGNQELFQSPILQEKLSLLCQSIRQAYRLKKSPQSFLWEQYLETSLAYQGE